jgi:hypothetical protein
LHCTTWSVILMGINLVIICATLNKSSYRSKSILPFNRAPTVRKLYSGLSHVRCRMGNLELGRFLLLGLAFSEIRVTVTFKQSVKTFLISKLVLLKAPLHPRIWNYLHHVSFWLYYALPFFSSLKNVFLHTSMKDTESLHFQLLFKYALHPQSGVFNTELYWRLLQTYYFQSKFLKKFLKKSNKFSVFICLSPIFSFLVNAVSNKVFRCNGIWNLHIFISKSCGNVKGKGTAIPLQAWTGPEGSRRMGLPDFKTIGTWSWSGCQPQAPAAFTSRKYTWHSFLLGAESTPRP